MSKQTVGYWHRRALDAEANADALTAESKTLREALSRAIPSVDSEFYFTIGDWQNMATELRVLLTPEVTCTRTTPELHMYADDIDTVIATSPEDATLVWREVYGAADDPGEWERVPDDTAKTRCFPENAGRANETRTAAEWVAADGRGWFGSTEY